MTTIYKLVSWDRSTETYEHRLVAYASRDYPTVLALRDLRLNQHPERVWNVIAVCHD